MKPALHIIWVSSVGWEIDYVNSDLFSLFEVTVHQSSYQSSTEQLFLNNAIIVYSCDDPEAPEGLVDYLREYRARGLHFCLLHLSNERLGHNFEYYDLANAVFRNYIDLRLAGRKNLLFVPLGYKTGAKTLELTPVREKRYGACFIGEPKNDRFELVDVLCSFNDSYIHTIRQWNCEKSLSIQLFQEISALSRFVPCPMGTVNFDTFRLFEVLESGSIPVVREYFNPEYYRLLLGDHPLPTVDSWQVLPELRTIIHDGVYDRTCREIREWYLQLKANLRKRIFEMIMASR